jgi:uncharacterized membrane protein
MAHENQITGTDVLTPEHPRVRRIDVSDLKEALRKGLDDFNAMPTHLIFLCMIYPIIMVIAARIYAGYDVLPLVFPALAGYTLLGPLVAIGMYELSRRRESGMDISRWHAFGVIRSQSIGALAVLGLLLAFIYCLWVGSAWVIFQETTGGTIPDSFETFVDLIFRTEDGRTLIIIGCTAGFVFSAIVLALSVVSFPMLLHQKIDVKLAIYTSIRAVLENPITMGTWGLIVVVFLVIGSLPAFIGLAVVLPILGHSTWHLYRRVIEL